MEWLTSIRRAVSYMEDHLTEEVSLDDVARVVHLSPFFLQRGFSLMTGFGVGEGRFNDPRVRGQIRIAQTQIDDILVCSRQNIRLTHSRALILPVSFSYKLVFHSGLLLFHRSRFFQRFDFFRRISH